MRRLSRGGLRVDREVLDRRITDRYRHQLEDGFLDADRYQQALAAELRFERGHFRFARSVALDEVERELTRPSFQLLLARHGIGDLGTSGLRITTSNGRSSHLG